jgi:hypothetical protein
MARASASDLLIIAASLPTPAPKTLAKLTLFAGWRPLPVISAT